MTALPDWDLASDAELATGAATGDRAAFAGIYDRYANRLHDFCIGMLRDRDAAADCVQDVFCIAATRLRDLRDAERLRPWLYAIARNEALRCIRERARERASDELPETASAEPGPDVMAARSELADLIAEAAGGLTDRDRAVLELSYRHGLDGPELAEALGVSRDSAKKMAQRLREGIERSLGALLVSRRAMSNPGSCAELGAILEGWDGQFSILMRKRIARHIESCPTCDEERRRLVNPVALLGAVPVFIPAPDWLRDRTLDQVQLSGAASASGETTTDGSGAPESAADASRAEGWRRHLTRRTMLGAALLLAILIASIAVGVAWLEERSPSITPANVTKTPPAPAPGGAGPLTARPTASAPPPAPSASLPATITTAVPNTPSPTVASIPSRPAPLPPVSAPPQGTVRPPTPPSPVPVRPTVPTAPPSSSPSRINGIPPTSKPVPKPPKPPPTSPPPIIQ
jgi:RNA polymerase sigma factor (sigma-70 family)